MDHEVRCMAKDLATSSIRTAFEASPHRAEHSTEHVHARRWIRSVVVSVGVRVRRQATHARQGCRRAVSGAMLGE